MDEDDLKLAEALRQQLENSGASTAFENEKDETPAADGADPSGLVAGPFADAMHAYRRAKANGTPEEIAAAERRLQEVVRAEMIADESCSNNGGEDAGDNGVNE